MVPSRAVIKAELRNKIAPIADIAAANSHRQRDLR
jgi:hypothetical protein